MMTRKNISFLFFVLMLFNSCQKLSPDKSKTKPFTDIHVQLNNSYCKPDNLPLMVALQKGWFEKNNIHVTYDQSKFDEKAYDLYFSKNAQKRFDLLVTGRALFYKLGVHSPEAYKIFAGQYLSQATPNYAILVEKKSVIHRLKQLSGKTIAFEKHSGAARYELMKLVLKGKKIDESKVRFLDINLTNMDSKKFDAIYIREPELAAAMATGRYRVLSKEPVAHYIQNPWPMGYAAFSTDFAQANPVTAQKVIQIWNQSIDFIRKNADAVKKIQIECMQKYYNVDHEPEELAFWKLEEIPRDLVQWQVDLYYKLKLLPKTYPAKQLFIDEKVVPVLQAAQLTEL